MVSREFLKLFSSSTKSSRHVFICKTGFSQPACSSECRTFIWGTPTQHFSERIWTSVSTHRHTYRTPLTDSSRYARIVTRVYQNPNLIERETAQRLLGWITCSKRSFKWHELQAAVSMDVQEQTLDFENRSLRTHVKDICGSLIDVMPGDRVQLVHATAKSWVCQALRSAYWNTKSQSSAIFPRMLD